VRETASACKSHSHLCHHPVPFEATVRHDHAPDGPYGANGTGLCTDELNT
jgi:hypothetical protein